MADCYVIGCPGEAPFEGHMCPEHEASGHRYAPGDQPRCGRPGCLESAVTQGLCTRHFVTDSFDEPVRRHVDGPRCVGCGRVFRREVPGATSCDECNSWPPRVPRCPDRTAVGDHECVRPTGHAGMHESASARWNEVIVEEQVEFQARPLFSGQVNPLVAALGVTGERALVGSPGALRVGDQIRVNGPDGPVVGLITSVQHTYQNGQDSGVVTFQPISSENPARSIPLGNHEMPRVQNQVQAPTWSELELRAMAESLTPEEVRAMPGTVAGFPVDHVLRLMGLDPGDVAAVQVTPATQVPIDVDVHVRTQEKLEETPRTRFERDDVI